MVQGPDHPHVELPGMTESYAPAVVKSRMASGNYGSLDFRVLLRANDKPELSDISEAELYAVLEDYFPVLK